MKISLKHKQFNEISLKQNLMKINQNIIKKIEFA